MGEYLKEVRDQYEDYPYPKRDPEKEKRKIYPTAFDAIEKINHYCFRGQLQHQKMRILVAGGGTGDAAIYLGEQLSGTNAKIVYVDISKASMQVAKQRAKVRKLKNIQWHHGSILDLPKMGLGRFDYINSSGVLHHLADPVAGLAALRSVLKDDGAMGIMVYAKYGRMAIYQIQTLLRLINQNTPDIEQQLTNARHLLPILQKLNCWFKHDAERYVKDINEYGDIGIYDLFLHTQDRAYSVPELYDWLENCDLNLIEFVDFPVGKPYEYRPDTYFTDQTLQQEVNLLPLKQQQAVAELTIGSMRKHCCFVSASTNTIAQLDNLDNIPYFYNNFINGGQIATAINSVPPGGQINISGKEFGDESMTSFYPQRYTQTIMTFIDGETPLKNIFEQVRGQLKQDISNETLIDDFRPIYQTLLDNSLLFLRHKSIPAYPTLVSMANRVSKYY